MKRALLPAELGLPIPLAAFGPLRTFAGHPRNHDRPDTGGVVWWDQADGAFGSAAVLRPAGSPFMPLRRTHRRPDPAPWSEATRGSKQRGGQQRGGQVLFCHIQRGGHIHGCSNEGVRSCFATSRGQGFLCQCGKTRPDPCPRTGLRLPRRWAFRIREVGVRTSPHSTMHAHVRGVTRPRGQVSSAGSGLVLPYRNARPDPFPGPLPA